MHPRHRRDGLPYGHGVRKRYLPKHVLHSSVPDVKSLRAVSRGSKEALERFAQQMMVCKAIEMNAYSLDLRLKVLEAIERGIPRKEVVRTFGISMPTLERYLRRRRQTGNLAPKPSPGRTPSILATVEERRMLWRQLEENADASLERHCELWEKERGVRVSISTMSRAIRHKLGWTLKKRVWEPPSETKRREVLGESG